MATIPLRTGRKPPRKLRDHGNIHDCLWAKLSKASLSGGVVRTTPRFSTDHVSDMVKKAIPVCLMFPLLGAGISYLAYGGMGGVSELSWQIGIVVAVACCFLLLLICAKYHGTNALMACGLMLSISVLAIYYFFGVFAYFYFFVFSSISAYFNWVSLICGGGLTVWWVWLACRNVRQTIAATPFVHKMFVESGGDVTYCLKDGMRTFEALCRDKSPFPKVLMYFVYGIAPFGLVVNRILSANFGGDGVLVFAAALGMPVSLWFAGLFVRVYFVMVTLPVRIEREKHKRVVVVA